MRNEKTETPGILGIDIGGTNFRIGVVYEQGKTANFRKIPVRSVFRTTDPMKDLREYIAEYCQNMDIRTISIGFPAAIDRERKTVLQAPNVAFMEGLPVVQYLTDAFHIPVYIERDVTMAVLYDRRKWSLWDQNMLCGFYFGTGIGNAIVIDGVPLVGRNGTAGELGHIPVDGSRELCGCGNRGCMENLAGGKYLAHLCESVFPDTPIGRLFLEKGEDPLLQQFIDRMAMTVATEVNILDPDCVLIGGGVPSMAGFPKERLVERILVHTRKPFPAQSLRVIFTGDEEDKCVIGAAEYAAMRMKRMN